MNLSKESLNLNDDSNNQAEQSIKTETGSDIIVNEPQQEGGSPNKKPLDIKGILSKMKMWQKVVIVLVLMVLSFDAGTQVAVDREIMKEIKIEKVEADEHYQSLLKDLQIARTSLDDLDKRISDSEVKLDENEALIKELEDYKQNKESIESDLAIKKDELETLNAEIKTGNETLAKLEGDIFAAQGQPVTLPAGAFLVGRDIDTGRYKVSGSSNFIVYSSSGDLKVNTILGKYGVSEYVCYLNDGDMMKCEGSDTFTPIE